MSQVEKESRKIFACGPLSNTKKICAKPHENILSFSRQGTLDNGQKWALNMALQSEDNNPYNIFVIATAIAKIDLRKFMKTYQNFLKK